MRYCQGTRCHTYDTKDRKKGSKDNKRNETRKRTSFYYGNNNFCSLNCQTDWFNTHGDNAINHFGRVEQPIVLDRLMHGKTDIIIISGMEITQTTYPDYIEVNTITKAENQRERVMTQEQLMKVKIKYLEDRITTMEKSIGRINKILGRFQMTEDKQEQGPIQGHRIRGE